MQGLEQRLEAYNLPSSVLYWHTLQAMRNLCWQRGPQYEKHPLQEWQLWLCLEVAGKASTPQEATVEVHRLQAMLP